MPDSPRSFPPGRSHPRSLERRSFGVPAAPDSGSVSTAGSARAHSSTLTFIEQLDRGNTASGARGDDHDRVREARDVLLRLAGSLFSLSARVDAGFSVAVDMILATEGHVVVIGVGKSGLVGRKLAATLASTGTPSFFVHAGEAFHGDLGMIRPRDVVILVSNSGETEEVVRLLPALARARLEMIGLVGNRESTIGRSCKAVLETAVDEEICPDRLAPTSSSLAALAMGDALAAGLMRERDLAAIGLVGSHSAISAGRRVPTRVSDAMRVRGLPMVDAEDCVGRALVAMSRGRAGMVLVMSDRRLVGTVTDGDLHRAVTDHPDLLSLPIRTIASTNPSTIAPEAHLDDAKAVMQARGERSLVVIDDASAICGILELGDC